MPQKTTYSLKIYAGSTFIKDVQWCNENEEPYPLTGYSARMSLRRAYGDAAALVSLTSAEGGGLSLIEASGIVRITITDIQTALLATDAEAEGVYDLEIVSPAGVVTKILRGGWIAFPEATK